MFTSGITGSDCVGACSTPPFLERSLVAAHELVGEHREILVHMFEYVGDWFALAWYLSTSCAWLQRQPALLHEVRGDALLWRGHVLHRDHAGLDPEFDEDREYGRWSLQQRIAYMGEMHPDDLERVYEWSSSSESYSSPSDFCWRVYRLGSRVRWHVV